MVVIQLLTNGVGCTGTKHSNLLTKFHFRQKFQCLNLSGEAFREKSGLTLHVEYPIYLIGY